MNNQHPPVNHTQHIQIILFETGRITKFAKWFPSNHENFIYLPEYELPIHVHGQVPKMQQHLVSSQLLFNDIVSIDHHYGHTDEEMEIVCLQQQRKKKKRQQLRGQVKRGHQVEYQSSLQDFLS